jgi:hypothetical protein
MSIITAIYLIMVVLFIIITNIRFKSDLVLKTPDKLRDWLLRNNAREGLGDSKDSCRARDST